MTLDLDYSIRKATLGDVAFIAEVIVGAEKSMTDKLGLGTIFDLSEERLKQLLISMLEEEVDGCEFSLSSFFVTLNKGKTVAAMGGWLEGYYDNIPSSLIKSNLISYFFSREKILKAQEKSEIIKGLQLEREKGTYQLEYVYVDPDHRGKELTKYLQEAHFAYAKQLYPGIKKVQAQEFESNLSSIRTLEKAGFKLAKKHVSYDENILNYLPFNVKVLMEKSIQ